MFYIGNNPILTDDIMVLETLKGHLALNGIYLFRDFKIGPSNIQFTCPVHNDGQERKPSCGISTVHHPKTPIGTVHCFTCGYTATLPEMVSRCFGKDDKGAFGKEWLVKNFLTISIENRKDIQLDLGRRAVKQPTQYVPEDELDLYRYYHDYMYQRKLTDEVIELFDVGYDGRFILLDKDGKPHKPMQCLTFPVRDKSGGTLFIARRSVNTKFFHYPDGVEKPVYGIYELPSDAEEVIICESIINTLTCYGYGKYSVGLLGLGTGGQYEALRKLPVRKFITALDPDAAGQAATAKLKKELGKTKLVTSYNMPVGLDINDLTLEQFENLQEIF